MARSQTLYTVDEAAAILRMSKSKLYRLARARLIPHGRFDRRVRFTQDDLDRIIADRHRPTVR